ncbi:YdbH domain-containing protein [Erythrobacter sp. R86502]|uniref:intermembrane phospholipid transport protein YdbH family protein n=1 Tax=Erythrobacter sp. R86502 TaxID=3093846 RepID=UPI0036D385C9
MPVSDAQPMDEPEGSSTQRLAPRRRRQRIALGMAAVVSLAVGSAWISRERIAGNAIDNYLQANGVAARYDIVTIGPQSQIVENFVVGDPARPDLVIRRLVVETGVGWAGPEVRRVRVEGARVFAKMSGGHVSFGALDPLVFSGADAPPALPAINVTIVDARALVESDYGRIGVSLAGEGQIDDGFAGTLAVVAPGIGTAGCRARSATMFGTLTTNEGAPAIDGPLRLRDVACGDAELERADIGALVSLNRDFSAAEADLRLTGKAMSFSQFSGTSLSGTARVNWAADRLAIGHNLTITAIASPHGRLEKLGAEGRWRGSVDGDSGQWEGALRGSRLDTGRAIAPRLDNAVRGAEGTLFAPLLARVQSAMQRSLVAADFRAEGIVRHKGATASLIVPDASLLSRNGVKVAALSRFGANLSARGLSGLGGNILVGGEGLPDINGRIEQRRGGDWTLRAAMADYAAGANRLAIPRLTLQGSASGAVAFEGLAQASGALPGGGVTDLTVPLQGTWSDSRGLALGLRCTPVRFERMVLSGLSLDGQSITLCPEGTAPLLAYDEALKLAARTGPLNFAGMLGENPASLSAKAVTLRYPQPFVIDDWKATIGAGDNEVRLSGVALEGSLAGEPAGTFNGGRARLAAVPLDLAAITGDWRYSHGVLQIANAAFVLSDRPAQGEARFFPLKANGASLTFADNRIAAAATLVHQPSDRRVAQLDITHDLGTAAGGARLSVPGLLFDKVFQPDDLTPLTKGVIALADGTITGAGQIDWQGDSLTSSGTFLSDGFDFAAAFGPVRGVSGAVVFTDLLNLTTAPDQTLKIAAINPGVEVLDGTVRFDLNDATLLNLKDARFSLMGGTLTMRPLTMDFSQPEARRYVFDITGLDAAQFVAQMELTNINATGIFDGTVPIVFDADGNGRIEEGLLTAREGGGNIAYLGELTYEDLGTMGNYAFSALRSLDYRQMRVGLRGDLAGEILTNFDFDGVRQGAGASQNFITRRLARLPIQFRINVRSESFSQLAIIARGYSDPTAWGDPFALGLVRYENGKLIMRDRVSPRIEGPPPQSEIPRGP